MQRAPVAVHRRSACSGVKALRNTSDARRQAAKLRYRFGPLTPSARSANLIPGDGAKNGLSRSEQKTVSTTQNNRLTGKAPYKFESPFLQRRVCEPSVPAKKHGGRHPPRPGSFLLTAAAAPEPPVDVEDLRGRPQPCPQQRLRLVYRFGVEP